MFPPSNLSTFPLPGKTPQDEADEIQRASLRFSTRTRSVKNYNEDDNNLWGLGSEDEEMKDNLTPAPADTEEGDVIEAVHDHRRKEGLDPNEPEDPETNMEYLIKWKGWSHLHDTWDTYATLKEFKGFRKLENYIQRHIIEEERFRANPETTKEQIEQQDINLERKRDELADWKTVERIIAMRESPPTDEIPYPHNEYFCKWKGLHYEDCTWEAVEIISNDFQAEIDAFLDREGSQHVPHKSASLTKGRSFDAIREQPGYISGGELRDYQLHGLNWMAYLWSKNQNGILADEMGLGKTVQTIGLLSYLFHTKHLYGPYLVVVPLSTTDNWMNEFKQWAPELNVVCYIGNRRSREVIRDHEFFLPGAHGSGPNSKKPKINVVVSTYEIVLKDRAELGAIKWTYLAVDEAHRLKNSQSQLHEALRDFNTVNRLLITGTPLQNNVKELLSLVNFLMPDMDMAELDIDFSLPESDQQEKIEQLHEKLKPLMLRRLKKDVEKSLPSKTERILRVELSPLQMHYYKHILTKNFAALQKSTEKHKKQWLNIAMELKKASNHPYLFPDAEKPSQQKTEQLKGLVMSSGKMVLLDKLLTRLKEGGHRVLIFSQFVMMLDILSDYMALRGYPHQRLDGSMKPEQRNKAIEHFNAPASPDFVFLLSTRAGGMGINLVTADTVIIFDSDWNPQNDLQAMSRAHRIGQTKSVNVYRFISKGTMEEDIIERAKRKMVLEYCIIKQMDTSGLSLLQKGALASTAAAMEKTASSSGKNKDLPFDKELSAILKFGAQNMFQANENTQKLDDMDLDDILARAEHTETMEVEGGESLGGEDFLSQFQIADYGGGSELSWDEIIPKDDREKFELEEKKKQQEELVERAAKRNRMTYQEKGDREEDDEDDDETGGLGTDHRKKRRRTTGGATATRRKPGAANGPADTLTEKDVRALIKGVQKYGNLRDRYDDIVADTDLEGKDRTILLAVADELMAVCVAEQEKKKADTNGPHDDDDVNGDSKTAKANSKKAVLITFKGVNSVNAGQVVGRATDLKVLADRLKSMASPEKFRLSIPLKPVQNWTCAWGQKEDAMLLVGIYKHGFGSWNKIQQDLALGLQKKFFLSSNNDDEEDDGGHTHKDAKEKEENKKAAPKAIQLVRRGEYLLKVLREAEEKKATYKKNANSTSKGPKRIPKTSASATNKDASTSSRAKESLSSSRGAKESSSSSRGAKETNGSHPTSKPAKSIPATTPKSAVKVKPKSPPTPSQDQTQQEEIDSAGSNYDSFDEDECKRLMKPVKRELRDLKKETGKLKGPEKAAMIRECLSEIGSQIRRVVDDHPVEERPRWRKHLWFFAKHFWPNKKISHKQMIEVYEKVGANGTPTNKNGGAKDDSVKKEKSLTNGDTKLKVAAEDEKLRKRYTNGEGGDESARKLKRFKGERSDGDLDDDRRDRSRRRRRDDHPVAVAVKVAVKV
ncbi:SNF2 family N-terminal domain-containing protein [Endogone sp. FLAS-F59071]|nr:SNF2 family N-terminal domain-containing protein [Endogone sp. FLAS-F59071]|eukprot:RUS15317.1 SNF2 family N-terminal domain-containing protein [Endogone sp. FLAS-F59071]